MGRAERRRQERDKIKAQKTYNYTENDLKRIKNEMVEVVAGEFLEAVFGISIMVLKQYAEKEAEKLIPEWKRRMLHVFLGGHYEKNQ